MCCKQWKMKTIITCSWSIVTHWVCQNYFSVEKTVWFQKASLPTWYPTQSTAQFTKICQRSSNFFTTIHFCFCNASGTMSHVLQLFCKENKNTENSLKLYQDETCSHKHYLHQLTHSLTWTTQHYLRLCKSCSWWADVCCFIISIIWIPQLQPREDLAARCLLHSC